MSSWWGKSSKEAKKKSNWESIIGSLHRKCIRPGGSRRYNSEDGSQSRQDSQFSSPSKQVSCYQSEGSHAQPLPLPCGRITSHADSEDGVLMEPSLDRSSKASSFLPLPNPGHEKSRQHAAISEGDMVISSNCSDCFSDNDDPPDSHLLSPQASDNEIVMTSDTPSPSVLKKKDLSLLAYKKNSLGTSKQTNILLAHKPLPSSCGQSPANSKLTQLQLPPPTALLSAPDSSTSSPSRSPMRVFGHEPNGGLFLGKLREDLSLLGSGLCSSPGSGHNSGHNSVTVDTPCQLFWPHSRCSPECSPLPSPRMTSPGPSSRIPSGAVTPLHPYTGGVSTESPTSWPDDGKQQRYPLPLPPTMVSNHSPFTSSGTSPRIPRSPGRTDNPSYLGSRWKRGRLLGSGTFGHVYLGFNSESGEMCAMKEVTLFSDDAKSRESAQQLGQEISLLSRLRHPNIVQYYGSEMVDDKLYIYLEFVSGGSIYKILQDYGQLGEAAIRSYTQQILSGLAYLHAKNTLHRDIKGANILVDPNGRVKLADFGMAKHINGPSFPLSVKGSPYWMAPEVIKNLGGCNLTVDIWSLGCTVLEMATTKPPWSQYEGVAALFKIGNSKELPAIPDHLSDEGKDFVRQCLQRNPCDRPTAAQLLGHPFVKLSSPSEKPSTSVPSLTHAIKTLDLIRCGTPCLESSGAVDPSKSPKTVLGFSDGSLARHISCPVSTPSPISSPRRLSPPISSSPISGASTPIDTPPKYHLMTANYLHEGRGMVSRSIPPEGDGSQDHKQDIFRGIIEAHLYQETVPRAENPVLCDKDQIDTHLALADCVSQQLLRNPVRPRPNSSMRNH